MIHASSLHCRRSALAASMLRTLFATILVASIAGCGGGSGNSYSGTPSTTEGNGTTTTTTPPAQPSQASSISFVSATPASTALVVKGAGGSGRTEIGLLKFKVVSASGVAVSGATVQFTLNSNSDATLSSASALTSSTGEVTATVQSGLLAAPIVVTATVTGVAGVTTLSDTMLVSNDVAIPGGFELVAKKYNLDGGLTGDSTTLTVFVRDANGNPVADGLAVSFSTDFGAVASASLGGCTTSNNNGTCDVTFRVQEPRGSGVATVTASALGQNSAVLSDQVEIHMASGSGYQALKTDGTLFSTATLSAAAKCSQTLELLLADSLGKSVAAGTTITVLGESGASASVLQGTPVLDQLASNFPPNRFLLTVTGTFVEANAATNTPAKCTGGSFILSFKSPGANLIFNQDVQVFAI